MLSIYIIFNVLFAVQKKNKREIRLQKLLLFEMEQ